MEDVNFRKGDAKTEVFGSNRMLQPSPVEKIPDGPTTPEIAYQMVKDETFAQTQPRLNLATFVTTYMDDYATKLMNEAININYSDERKMYQHRSKPVELSGKGYLENRCAGHWFK